MEQTELQALLDKCGLSAGFIGFSVSHSSRILESNSDIQTCASADTEYLSDTKRRLDLVLVQAMEGGPGRGSVCVGPTRLTSAYQRATWCRASPWTLPSCGPGVGCEDGFHWVFWWDMEDVA